MKEQKKELKRENKELKGFEKISHYLTNLAVFYIHEKTSDFSQIWWLPVIWLFVVGMVGIIYRNFDKIDFLGSIPILLLWLFVCYILPIAYKDITNKKQIPKALIYLLLILPVVWTYVQVSSDYFNDIAMLLNPSNIFKPIILEKNHEFISLLYKILVLFLVYQVIASVKKKVRSK
jgi:hypothetical protein